MNELSKRASETSEFQSSTTSPLNMPFERKESVYQSAENVSIELNSLNSEHSEDVTDFVLVYCQVNDEDEQILQKRDTFENNLRREGMILRYENVSKLRFVKIQLTEEVLIRYCDILKLRMPIKETHCAKPENCEKNDFLDEIKTYYNKIGDYLNITLDKNAFPDHKYQLTAEFSKDKQYLFDLNAKNFFSTSVRSIVVYFILERLKFNEDKEAVFDVGIQKLLSDNVYSAAYPLHDGAPKQSGSQRNLLLDEWAGMKNCLKLQPIDLIKNYFGVKVAMYFVWLGFYTHMLISASIIGLVSVAYGFWTDSWNNLVDDICTNKSRIMMCPLCDTYCDYWDLFETCNYARISHFFDNNVTVVFSILMSFWSALYLGLWKRYSATITHNWGLADLDVQAEHPRPQYLARLANAKKKKINIITRSLEPKVPFWRIKFPAICFSFSICLLWILIALAAVFGVVIYRMSIVTSKSLFKDKSITYINIMVSVTAGMINLICILLLNWIYDYLAEWLTELELQRTQTEFDNSLELKIYMFQFVNYYSSIFYIAFLKGKFVGYPAKYNRIFGFRQEECNPGGCLMELCIQLAVIMIGKQAFHTVLELFWPLFVKFYRKMTTKSEIKKHDRNASPAKSQWLADYNLLELNHRGICDEYLAMVLQYGFVTIFVTAFPLAPLFALLNNIFEMRFDAQKIIQHYRRPVPKNVKNIGVWLNIMNVLGKISVFSNAFLIAFSSNLIPNVVYYLKIKDGPDDNGFLNSTLSYFNVSDFESGRSPIHSEFNVTICRYLEYRNPPWHPNKYKRPMLYWQILAFRLGFIVLFQNLVTFVTLIVQWAIPEVPKKLEAKMKIESLRTSEIIMQTEMMRAAHKLNDNL